MDRLSCPTFVPILLITWEVHPLPSLVSLVVCLLDDFAYFECHSHKSLYNSHVLEQVCVIYYEFVTFSLKNKLSEIWKYKLNFIY